MSLVEVAVSVAMRRRTTEQMTTEEVERVLLRARRNDGPAVPFDLTAARSRSPARRMSWTTDREQAIWFANRFGDVSAVGPGNLYEVVAPPQAILADVAAVESHGGRQEREVIVDPRRLPRLRRVREWPRRSR